MPSIYAHIFIKAVVIIYTENRFSCTILQLSVFKCFRYLTATDDNTATPSFFGVRKLSKAVRSSLQSSYTHLLMALSEPSRLRRLLNLRGDNNQVTWDPRDSVLDIWMGYSGRGQNGNATVEKPYNFAISMRPYNELSESFAFLALFRLNFVSEIGYNVFRIFQFNFARMEDTIKFRCNASPSNCFDGAQYRLFDQCV